MCESSDITGYILWDVADTVAIAGEYLNGLRVVGIGWVGFQGGDKLSEMVVYVFSVCDACNLEFDVVYTLKALIFWPYADVIAFALDTEVAETPNLWLFVIIRTDIHMDRR